MKNKACTNGMKNLWGGAKKDKPQRFKFISWRFDGGCDIVYCLLSF